MKKTCVLVLSVAVVATLNLAAHAQFQINNGNAADANTRAGSYGSNGYRQEEPINSATVNGNQIVTGNVTGGRALQTNPGYFAPGQLETNTGTEEFQDFIRDSVGVPAPYQQSQPAYTVAQPFYSGTTTASPPAGFTRDTTTGSYVPVVQPSRQLSYDTRIGLLNPAGLTPADAGLASNAIPVPDNGVVSGASLYGTKATTAQDVDDNSPFFSAYKQWSTQDRQQTNQSTLDEMRSELNQSNAANPNANGTSIPAPPGVTPASVSPRSVSPQAIGTEANQSYLAVNMQQPPAGSKTQQNPALMSPTQQSAQYAQLQQRYQQFQNSTENSPALPEANQDNTTASGAQTPEEKTRLRADLYPPSVASSPLMIHSLAVGIRARGLRDLMADAEEHMRQGHYDEAMIRYGAAGQVAPNNPLVTLGKAYAELGAGYYLRAARDLREGLQGDPALLMGRYDMKNLLGETRLEYIVRDLKQIANSDQQNADAPFLLAYIAYNTGSSSAAGQYLDLAEQRRGGHLPVYGLMRQYWALSSAKK